MVEFIIYCVSKLKSLISFFPLQFPVSSLTWGHNDKRLFCATGNEIHIGWVSSAIASLQLLSRLKIHNSLKNSDQVQLLPLPCRLQNLIGMLFTQTIRVRTYQYLPTYFWIDKRAKKILEKHYIFSCDVTNYLQHVRYW